MIHMILWAKPKPLDIDGMADVVYPMLELLKGYGEELDPRYEKVPMKSLAKEFDFNYASVRELLRRNLNERQILDTVFSTSNAGFFSSLDDSKSSGVNISIGRLDPRFNNTCTMQFPEVFSGFLERRDDFVVLFKQLIELFNPYYGFVPEYENKPKDITYWEDDKPSSVYWLNYFDKDTAKAIGRWRLLTSKGIERFNDGYFLRMQDELIDIHNPAHLALQAEWNRKLGLVGFGEQIESD